MHSQATIFYGYRWMMDGWMGMIGPLTSTQWQVGGVRLMAAIGGWRLVSERREQGTSAGISSSIERTNRRTCGSEWSSRVLPSSDTIVAEGRQTGDGRDGRRGRRVARHASDV
jgi:hypothetical protein